MNNDWKNILDFWFSLSFNDWFSQSDNLDKKCVDLFSDYYDRLEQNTLEEWRYKKESNLAYIILCDQLSRNVFRHSRRMYQYDERALSATFISLYEGFYEQWDHAHKMFILLPFEHSEKMEHQILSIYLFRQLGNKQWLHYAQLHYDIIARFGHFPHRNTIVGRKTSDEEAQFLQEENSSF